ncbi:MAG: hypothetical protein ACJ8F7_05815 [Gemmataceae bacterium]
MLRRLAVANIVLHLFALALAALYMRPGSPRVPPAERMAYLADHAVGWQIAWAVWIGCIGLMVAFAAVAANRLPADNLLARLAVTVAIVAGAFDLLGDSTFIIALPYVAALKPPNEQLFLAVERCTLTLSLVVANGLYSLGTLLLALAARKRLRRFTFAAGVAVFAFGLLLALAAFTGVPWHAEAATGPTIGLYCVWVWLAARDLEAR